MKISNNKISIFSLIVLMSTLTFQFAPFFQIGVDSTELKNDINFNVFSSSLMDFDWEVIWGGSNSDVCTQMAIDSEDNIYLSGYTYNFGGVSNALLIKFNSSGDLQWYDVWGGPETDGNYGVDIAIDAFDDIYIYGETESFGAGRKDIFIAKYDNTGLQLWNRTWGGYSEEYVYSLKFDSNNNVYLGCTTYSVPNNNDFLLLKYSSDGTLLWNRTWGITNMNTGHYLAIDSSNNIYFTGSYDSGIVLLKYNESGDLQWYESRGDAMWPNGILLDSNEDIYIAASGICLMKYNSSGDLKWIQKWDGIINNYGDSILIDSNDNVYMAYRFTDGDYDVYLVKFNMEGILQWKKNWGGSDYEHCNAMEIDSNDAIYLAGETRSFGSGEEDVFFLRYDTSGNLIFEEIWAKEYRDYGEDLALDSKYSLYLAGRTLNSAFRSNIFLLKYLNTPRLEINSPIENEIFGIRPPNYNISIFDFDAESTWYQVNNGLNYSFYETNGIIEQELWDQCADGQIKISFFANDTSGREISNETIVFKDIDIHINSPIQNQVFGLSSPNFDISLPDIDLYTTFYSLNNGANYTFTGLTGKINQTEWVKCIIGQVRIDFYAQDYNGNLINKEVLVEKDVRLETRNAYAIIVAIEDYPDPYSDLYYTIDDANSIYSRLHNNYGFDDTPIGIQYIELLLDSDATKSDIEGAFSQVEHYINPQDIFFFYFSGHGHPSSIPGLSYLFPYDLDRIYSTDLDAYLDSVNCSEQYIIIDSCGSGGLIDDAQAPNRYFMTACERNEISWEASALQHGVFTYYFLHSFTQAPDSNGDGVISMEEQFSYTYPRTVSYSTNLGEAHHPQEYDGIAGESVIDTAIGSLMFTPNGTQLDYSFFLYGHGSITTLEITACCVAENITIETFDLIPEAPSTTGFGYYSGNLEVSCDYNITGYEIRAVVDWSKNPPGDPKTIQHIFGDTDGDGLEDLLEIANGLNPRTPDMDSDGLSDYFEFYGITDPTLNDTDGDSMLDGYEVFYGLDPLTDDSLLDLDGDGLINIQEYNLGTYANNPDTDEDSMDDGYEFEYGLDLFSNDAGLDLDGDGLSNGIECQYGSMANNSDSDDDTMPDKWEYDNNLDLNFDDANLDPDGDNLNNLAEYQNDTDPHIADTDGDTWNDGDEVEQGTDPLDPDDYPKTPDGYPNTPNVVSSYPLFLIASVLLIGSIIFIRKMRFKINKS